MKKSTARKPTEAQVWLWCVCAAATLSACGGGADGSSVGASDQSASRTVASASLASGTTTLQLDGVALPDAVATLSAQPSFHAAPVLLSEPANVNTADPMAAAHQAPQTQAVPAATDGLPTRHMTVQSLQAAHRSHALSVGGNNGVAPKATASVVATYSPAQIRSAYGLPALPASTTGLTAAQAAQLGAGQTIYIVDAMHDPNAAAELATFNTKFGLPACTTKAISATAALPLAAASAAACEFSVVYNTAAGTMTTAAPAYDAGWATEITLDVQWAHATAPLARIVLIEAPDASINSLVGAVRLANAMGPGVVSMSFGAGEGSWTTSVDSAFAAANMTYLAATGDNGAAVSWPAVSPYVVAVGGTTLTYTGTGARSETGWAGTGGGTSLYTPTPSYQTNVVPGLGSVGHRTVADVAFNADPSTGQYIAVMSPGSTAVSWLSVGGTSLSTPQWAGLVAVANAMRAQTAKPALGAPHALLYGQIATVPGIYASAFADVIKGADGVCTTCTAKAGYDQLTGLGTPNVGALLSTLTGMAAPATAPVVTPATISGTVGTALSFTASTTAPNPLTYALTGAPAGMAINTAGAITWPSPLVGTYAVTVVAKDTKTALSGQGVYTVTIAAPKPPVVSSSAVSGKVGVALSFTASVSAPNPVTYALSGAPAGMAISTAGVVTWAAPTLGTFNVTVVAKDTKTGLSSSGVYTVQITTAGPTIAAAAMTGTVGKPLSGTIVIAAPGARALSVSISGVPMGMTFSVSGMTFTAYWAKPVAGTYNMTVRVVDSAGLSATTVVPITVK